MDGKPFAPRGTVLTWVRLDSGTEGELIPRQDIAQRQRLRYHLALMATPQLRRIHMEVTPSLKAVRFAQLAPGDLFIMQRPPGSHLALTVRDPKAAKDPSANEKYGLTP